MMRLFGGFGAGCFAAYDEVSPLAPGWKERVALHQIAPLVVHAIKFGGGYVAAAEPGDRRLRLSTTAVIGSRTMARACRRLSSCRRISWFRCRPRWDDLRLSPLGPEHNASDYAAWTSSIDHIRATPGFPDGSWPHPMPVAVAGFASAPAAP